MGHRRPTRPDRGYHAQPLSTRHYDPKQRADAARLDQREPCWVIWYGPWSREFFAIPMWPWPTGVIVRALSVRELEALMREAEHKAGNSPLPRAS